MDFETKPHNLVKPTRSSKQATLGWPTHHLTVFMGVSIHMVQDKLSFKTGPILVTKLEKMLEKIIIHEGPKILETMFFPWFWINTLWDPPFIFKVFRLQFAICYPKMTTDSYFFLYWKLAQKKLSNFTQFQFLND